MKITDIIDVTELETEIAAGYINRRFHPEFPTLALVGYSDRAQFDNHWTPTVRACRGLIYDTTTGDVIARPFAKFFNFGQTGAQYDLDAPILGAYDKLDGSLGIGYMRPDGKAAIATRGSFVSDQAKHATALLSSHTFFDPGETDLFEIIYPENRIVVNYGERDELAFLGTVLWQTGEFIPTPVLKEHTARTLREVLALPPRKNAEGFVAWLDAHTAVKFKQDDYLALHRIVSSLTVKEMWRQCRAGTVEEFMVALPDEFHQWAAETYRDLQDDYWTVSDNAVRDLQAVWRAVPNGTRKDEALWINEHVPADYRGLVFSLLNGKSIEDAIWRRIEPKMTEDWREELAA